MVISVQGDHLLSVLREICVHKNLWTYTPGEGYSSRVGDTKSVICDEKAIAFFMRELAFLTGITRKTRIRDAML